MPGDQGNFAEYLLAYKNSQMAVQAQQDAASAGQFGGASNLKPLGLNKNKARAALNNLKNNSVQGQPRAPPSDEAQALLHQAQ